MVSFAELDPRLSVSERLFILSELAHKEGRTQEGHEIGASARDAQLRESIARDDERRAMIQGRER